MDGMGYPGNSLDRETSPLVGGEEKKRNYGIGVVVSEDCDSGEVLDFVGSIAYECLVDKFQLWETLPDVDVGNLKYYGDELRRCSPREVASLEKRFGKLLRKLEDKNESTSFVKGMQNTCWIIINGKK